MNIPAFMCPADDLFVPLFVHSVAILSEGFYHEKEIYERHAQDGAGADSESKSSIVRKRGVDQVFCCAGAPRISHDAGYEEDE